MNAHIMRAQDEAKTAGSAREESIFSNWENVSTFVFIRL